MNEKELENKKKTDSYQLELISTVEDYSTKLVGVGNIKIFFDNELKYWQEVETKGSIVNSYIRYLDKCINQIQLIISNLPNWNLPELENQWNDFHNSAIRQTPDNNTNHKYIFSTSSKAEYLKDLYSQDVSIAEGAHNYFLDIGVNFNNNKEQFIGYLKAFIFEQQANKEIFSRKSYEQKSFEVLSKRWEENTNRINTQYDNLSTELDEWKNKFIISNDKWNAERQTNLDDYVKEEKKTLTDLEELYTKKLQFSGPVIYWKERAKKFKYNGIIWASLLSIVILVSAILLFSVLYNLPDAFHYKIFNGEPQAIRGILLFITIISFLAYLAKTFSKLTFSSFHLQRDSEEREQLTFVYLALIEKGAIGEKDRELILQSLFSRSDTGLLSGDGNPTIPGIQNIFDKFK